VRGAFTRAPAPAAWAAAAFATGILAAALHVESSGAALVLLSAGCFAGLFVRHARIRRAAALTLFLGAGYLRGRGGAVLSAERTARTVAASGEAPVTLVGVVDAPWSASGSRWRTSLRVETARLAGRALQIETPVTLVVSGTRHPLETVETGARVRVEGPLRLPEETAARTPFELPPEPVLPVKSAEQIERLAGPTGPLAPIRRLHAFVARHLLALAKDSSPADRRALALLEAMTLGDTADLPLDASTAFREGGVAHILAISGLHLGLVAALVAALLRPLPLRVPARDALVLAAGLVYAVFAGLAAPVVRAALMLALALGARLLGRPTSGRQTLGLAALALLAVTPKHLFEVGFLLTFAAVAGIGALGMPIARRLRALRVPEFAADALGATLGAELAVLPIQALAFNTVPIASLLSNLLLIPLAGLFLTVSLAVLPLLLVPATAAFALVPVRLLADTQLLALGALESLRPLRFVPTPSFVLASSCAGLLALGAALRGRPRAAALLGGSVAALAIAAAPASHPVSPRLDAVDVGQGDSWVVSSPSGRVLVDGGGSVDAAYDFGRARLLPRLGDLGAVAFDAVVLTHPHPDHARGLLAVLRLAPVSLLVLPEGASRNPFLDEVLAGAARRGVPVLRAGLGSRIEAAGLVLEVLHPGEETYPRGKENNGSLVLSTHLAGRRVLFTGDIEGLAERDLVARGGLLADVLKVPHHGSRTSSSPAFLAAVAPRVALIGVGRKNPYGHPARDVLERLRAAHARTLRTDLDGDFALAFGSGHVWPLLVGLGGGKGAP
jgi:competence protein ComEC